MADELQRVRARRTRKDREAERAELLAKTKALSEWVDSGLMDTVPLGQALTIMGDRMPEPHRIPIKTLRRLHDALSTFMAEAQEAENAKLLRKRREVCDV